MIFEFYWTHWKSIFKIKFGAVHQTGKIHQQKIFYASNVSSESTTTAEISVLTIKTNSRSYIFLLQRSLKKKSANSNWKLLDFLCTLQNFSTQIERIYNW